MVGKKGIVEPWKAAAKGFCKEGTSGYLWCARLCSGLVGSIARDCGTCIPLLIDDDIGDLSGKVTDGGIQNLGEAPAVDIDVRDKHWGFGTPRWALKYHTMKMAISENQFFGQKQ